MTESDDREVMVLLSGGIDSAACLRLYTEFGRFPCALFVDYGQPAASEELQAAKQIARHYRVPLHLARWRPVIGKGLGRIPARNVFLLSAALMERPEHVSVIAIGIHAGTLYTDCSSEFFSAMRTVCAISEQDGVELAAPFLTWTKADILSFCGSRDLPLHMTYSCELGGPVPCGNCISCKDREHVDACTSVAP